MDLVEAADDGGFGALAFFGHSFGAPLLDAIHPENGEDGGVFSAAFGIQLVNERHGSASDVFVPGFAWWLGEPGKDFARCFWGMESSVFGQGNRRIEREKGGVNSCEALERGNVHGARGWAEQDKFLVEGGDEVGDSRGLD